MELVQVILWLLFGFLILIKGADFLVEGASAVAKRFNISDMIIGLTIVSFGTSAPELVVNIQAAVNGENEVILGNILGSNIFNTCLILGVAGLIYPLVVHKETMLKEFPFSVLIIILLFFLANDAMFIGGDNFLSKFDGIIFLILFFCFLCYVYSSAKASIAKSGEEDAEKIKSLSLPNSVIYIAGGMLGLVYGGELVLENAVFLAEEFGMTKRVIGLTVVAIGTSLPELATSVVAAMKKNSDIAIGNVIGSNIFNILLVLGFSAAVSPHPIHYDVASNFDVYFLFISTVALSVFLFTGTKGKINKAGAMTYFIDRWQAGILFSAVIGYLAFLLMM
ncbi:MAG: calcium/sodium antiporter [Saprospiraceae bacterium]|nr:calcium/sodium antiporter [Saprospiraceae bacterium]